MTPAQGAALSPAGRRLLKQKFLEDFAKTGIISESCANVGISSRGTIYAWQEQDEEFAAGFREADLKATEVLEAEARRRAQEGVKRVIPIYHNGVQVDSIVETKYSDTLLIFLLKARAPHKYRENVNLHHSGKVEQELSITKVREALGV